MAEEAAWGERKREKGWVYWITWNPFQVSDFFPERHDLVQAQRVASADLEARLPAMIETFKLSIYSSTEAARAAVELEAGAAAAAHSFENPNKPLKGPERDAILKVAPPPKLLRLESRQAGTVNQADSLSECEEHRGPGASLTANGSLRYDAMVLPPFRQSSN